MAQTVDWNPPHVYETDARQAHNHPGLAFVRVLQRCPHYLPGAFDGVQENPTGVLLLTHSDGIPVEKPLLKMFTNNVEHDPSDLKGARDYAGREDVIPIGLFYRDRDAERYDEATVEGLGMSDAEKVEHVRKELDRFLI